MVLWGLMFVIVLTMISGARELMTPGAWKKDGLTYQLNDRDQRRQHLRELGRQLLLYAAVHGELPASLELGGWPAQQNEAPGAAGMTYEYFPSQDLKTHATSLLAREPERFGDDRLALLTDGRVVAANSLERELR